MSISLTHSLSKRFIANCAICLAAIDRLCRVVGGWASVGPARFDLDSMSEDHLADIGLRRFSHREHWIDGSETALPASTDYESRPNAP